MSKTVKDLMSGIVINRVEGNFHCSGNDLTSLEGCPEYVGGSFDCMNNNLTSIEGCSEYVGGSFDCSNNELTTLVGCPERIEGNFYIHSNKLTSLEGFPKYVMYSVICGSNPGKFTEEDVRAVCEVRGSVYV